MVILKHMKQLHSILGFLTMLAFISFSLLTCSPPDDDEEPDNKNEDKPEITFSIKSGNGYVNNRSAIAVIGPSLEEMQWFDYQAHKFPNQEKQKAKLVDMSNFDYERFDTVYMTPNLVAEGQGGIAIDELPTGEYGIHIVDGGLKVHVGTYSFTKDQGEQKEVRTQRLGRVIVEARRTSVAGTGVNDVTVGLFGTGQDSTNEAFKEDFSDVAYAPYYQGVTANVAKRNGIAQDGYVFFHFIPMREYFVVGYHEQLSKQKVPSEYAMVTKNGTTNILLTFN